MTAELSEQPCFHTEAERQETAYFIFAAKQLQSIQQNPRHVNTTQNIRNTFGCLISKLALFRIN